METKRITTIPGLNHLWKVDNIYLAGQPSLDSVAGIKELGVSKVFNLRGKDEMDFGPEEDAFKAADLSYEHYPLLDENKRLSKERTDKLSKMVEAEDTVFIHCGSANRVAAWLITYLVEYKGMEFEDAVDVASENGLSSPAFIEQAQEIMSKS